MMRWFILSILLFVAIGCATEARNTPTIGSEAISMATEEIQQPAMTETPETASAPITQSAAAPAVVDLAKVTPGGAEGSTGVEMPAPRIPNPKIMASHKSKLDLAGRLGIDIDQIEVVTTEEMTWPDTSLGCPQPDTMYSQVEVKGYQVTLKANGQEFVYHTAGMDEVKLCSGEG